MNLLLDEVARATLRLAEAGVASPRADAEELAAFVHGVRRGELHTVADSDFDARYWVPVPRTQMLGPAACVYWPLSVRWGIGAVR